VLEKINTQLNNCLQLVREMANLLMPNILQRKGLRKALEEFIANIAPVVHFEIHFVFPEFNISFNKEKELNVYRIIQEIVTNTIKHSGCTKLEIIFSKSETAVLINSLDIGFGFHLDDILYATKGCGIANIRNRINLLNGKMQIDTKINEGTRYNISIPLSNI
jgi:signal transduction histidine kinase